MKKVETPKSHLSTNLINAEFQPLAQLKRILEARKTLKNADVVAPWPILSSFDPMGAAGNVKCRWENMYGHPRNLGVLKRI